MTLKATLRQNNATIQASTGYSKRVFSRIMLKKVNIVSSTGQFYVFLLFTGHCFCVTSHNGEVIQSSKVLGSADCSSHSPARRDLTQCQQMYQLRMISFVIYQGMWTPKCDAEGKFEPVQCDNTGKFLLIGPSDFI